MREFLVNGRIYLDNYSEIFIFYFICLLISLFIYWKYAFSGLLEAIIYNIL